MTINEQILWSNLSKFKLDDENSSFKFSHRLARENGWSIKYAKRTIEEYKKFIFLCCISETGVTPSDQVDQVWHLHLTYTGSYWVDLCKNTLSREIHHMPTKGGDSEGKKFDNYYTGTLKLYKEKFNCEAPSDIWPDNKKRFSDIHFQRVNTKKYWIIRKPDIAGKNTTIFLILVFTFFFIQSRSDQGVWGFVTVSFLIITIWNLFKNNGGGSGCSTNGCDSAHSGCNGHSGCGGDSGCSGCSGCGGD